MRKLNKTLIAAAVAGLMAIPAAHAVENAFYAKSSVGSFKFSGSGCKSDGEKKLDASLYTNSSFGAGIEGGIEGGTNTGFFFFQMFLFSDEVDGEGILVASNKGRTLNMDTSAGGYDDLEYVMMDYAESGACKKAVEFEPYNYDTVITKYEGKLSKKGDKVKVQMDAEGTYEDTKGKDKKIKLKIKTSNMDRQAM